MCLECKSRYAIVASSLEVEGAPEENRDLEYLFLVEQKDVDERERARLAEVAAEHDLRRLRSVLVEEAIRRVEAVKGEQRYSLAAKIFAFPDSVTVKAFIAGRHVKTWVSEAAKQRFDALTLYFGRTDELVAKKARCDEMKRVRKELGLPLVRYTLHRTSMAALLERML